MKKLKIILISIITTIVGILSFIFISKSKKTKRELEDEIERNNEEISEIETEITEVKKEQDIVEIKINDKKETISDLKDQKENIVVSKSEDVKSAKDNILDKINKRK
jgi:septal ring factor EnvC (AmiA/AmiB activator)